MSRHIIVNTLVRRRYALALPLVLALFLVTFVDPNTDYKNFLAAATRAPQDGYTMYWLGRNPTVGGLVFEGPGVSGFGADIEGGGINLHYNAKGGP